MTLVSLHLDDFGSEFLVKIRLSVHIFFPFYDTDIVISYNFSFSPQLEFQQMEGVERGEYEERKKVEYI